MDRQGPGIGYVLARVWRVAFPKVSVTRPAEMVFERDVAVRMRDGVTLRVNVFRPATPGKFPVLMCAHPYGKDVLPRRVPWGFVPVKRYRFLRQPDPITFSAHTSWEAPDPSYWVPRGYVVVNVDLRGFGTSGGVGTLLSDQEANDYAEVIDWAAAQPWSTGKVGLNGVSYLAISQWKVAALRPPHLAAICPWEGWSDIYHDVAYPGGVREDGFLPFWASMTERSGRTTGSLREQQLAHPNWDEFWSSRVPNLEAITVPALICASFSDQGLHTRGSFEAFRRVGSAHRYLYTHRGGKWSTYYSSEALAVQTRFFDCFLKDIDNGMRTAAPVRLEVRTRGDLVHDIRDEPAWPPTNTEWTTLHLEPGRLRKQPFDRPAHAHLAAPDGGLSFSYPVAHDMRVVGPMTLTLHIQLRDATDAHLFIAVRKFHNGRHVDFEGSFGFGCDVVTKGWLRIAHRRLDHKRSDPTHPVHPCDRPEPLPIGETAAAVIELLPSATFFARGDTLRLDIQTRWFWRHNRLIAPGGYQPSPPGTVILHFGPEHPSHLLVPIARIADHQPDT